jgi:hypothetical protein
MTFLGSRYHLPERVNQHRGVLIFVDCLLLFFFGCVYLCSHLPCAFAGWAPALGLFIFAGFFFFFLGIFVCTQSGDHP